MDFIEKIKMIYDEIETMYSSMEFDARASGDNENEDLYNNLRDINTHTYFLFIFTRLEEHIKNESNNLIHFKKSTLLDWKERAIWDITPTNLSFLNRVKLLTEFGQSDYDLIKNYYSTRNRIAHGGTISDIRTVINMEDVFENIKRFLIDLRI